MLYSRDGVDIGHRVGHYDGCVKIWLHEYECRYHCLQKTILNGDDLSV